MQLNKHIWPRKYDPAEAPIFTNKENGTQISFRDKDIRLGVKRMLEFAKLIRGHMAGGPPVFPPRSSCSCVCSPVSPVFTTNRFPPPFHASLVFSMLCHKPYCSARFPLFTRLSLGLRPVESTRTTVTSAQLNNSECLKVSKVAILAQEPVFACVHDLVLETEWQMKLNK